MVVRVIFMGPLREYAGQEEVVFHLPQGAKYGEILGEIGKRFAGRFPDRIWDGKELAFRPGILAIGDGRDLDSREISLVDGELIRIVPLMAGG